MRHPFNLGIGATVQTGLRFACEEDYDIVFRLDGDGQHNHADLPRLHAALGENRVDSAFGSRFLGNEFDDEDPICPACGYEPVRILVTLLTRQRATDTTSGLCCLNRRVVEVLAEYLPQDYPEVEGRVVLHKAGLRTLECRCGCGRVPPALASLTAGVDLWPRSRCRWRC